MKPSILVDTSVWIEVWRRDATGPQEALQRELEDADTYFSALVQLEVLAGSIHEKEWRALRHFFAGQIFLPVLDESWERAARIFFDLRRRGLTVRSLVDCCLAQQALDHDLLLLHRDRDYEAIARVRPLRQRYLDL